MAGSETETLMQRSHTGEGGARSGDLDLEARVREILNRRPAVGLAMGVVRNGHLEAFSAHGLADIATGTPITQDTVFRIGSITKTFTAVAVMQLWEKGLIDLDAPVSHHLRSYRLIPARAAWRPATVRHLLTHTSGIPELVRPARALRSGWFGESVPLGRSVPPLAEFYRGGLRLVAEPGSTFAYTDHNFATLGQIVEDVSGEPLHRYFRDHIFQPLGMADTDLLRSERLEGRLATGYKLGAGGPRRVTDRQWVTLAASSIYSTPRDMARYLAALNAGAEEDGTLLRPRTRSAMLGPNYQPDPRVPGFGLGFYLTDVGGGQVAAEHPGILPGFNSQVFLAPDRGVAVMAFTNGARNALVWLITEAGRLLGDLIGAPTDVIRTDVPQHPEIWGELCGWYTPVAQRTDVQAHSMAGAGVQVVVRRGRLTLRSLSPLSALYRGFLLHPDDDNDPYAFRLDLSDHDLGTARVVFSRRDGTTRMYPDVIPFSLEKRPGAGDPRLRIAGGLILGAVAVAARCRRAARRGPGHGS